MPLRPPKIRTLIASIVLAPVLLTGAVLVVIATWSNQRLADRLGDTILGGATRSVSSQVRSFLQDAIETGDRFAIRAESSRLDPQSLDGWLDPILDELETNTHVAAITFGTPDDRSIYVQRMPHGIEFAVTSAEQSPDRQYVLWGERRPSTQPNREYDYVPTQRPWYRAAMASDVPRWTEVYTWLPDENNGATMGAAYVRAARRDGQLLGVVCVDVTLDGMSRFLKSIAPTPRSALFILDDKGKLVAGSVGRIDKAGERASLADSDDPIASALGHQLSRAGLDAGMTRNARVTVAGEPYRVRLEQLAPFPGVQWQVVAALPEAELLADARDTQRRGVLLASVVALGGLVFAFNIARRIARPILDVQRHVDRVAAGDFESRIRVGGARELVELSNDLNQMSADLRSRVEMMQSLRLATEVQQSLLPRTNPTISRLDVHGVSRYCDQTGGDYFDFIEMTESASGELLIAIGDVMGHGIGSAMLMASARGALRAVLLGNADLADALRRVNEILVQGDSGLFMTMTLMRIAPETGVAHWASAGHDAAVVYEPRSGDFRELDGAEVPLGLMPGMDYQLYHASDLRTDVVMIIGTDGIWEMKNAAHEEYGKERMKDVLRKHASQTAKEVGAALDADLEAFRGTSPIYDDVTYVIVKFV